jgi:hypothetical protein
LTQALLQFLILVVFGAFGGFVGALDPTANYRMRPLRRDSDGTWELGWLGGLLIGVAAAVGIMLIGDTFGVLRATGVDSFQFMRLAALGVIAGYVGQSLLGSLGQIVMDIAKREVEQQTDKIQQQLKEDVAKEGEKMLAMNDAIAEGDRLLQQGDCEQARLSYERLERLFPSQRLRARKGIANCVAYKGRNEKNEATLVEADRLLADLAAEFPDNPDIAYNAFWVRVLISELRREKGLPPTYTTEQLRSTLESAIQLDPDSKRWARYEPDFQQLLRREASIAELVGGAPEPVATYRWKDGEKEYHLPHCEKVEGEGWKEGADPPPLYSPCKICMPQPPR